MLAADVGPGDEVLLPGYFWVACASSIVRAGGIPRLVDIDDTFTMDPDDLERKINERTKAVLLIHISGTCGDLDRIVEICQRRGVLLIEDVAQANGGKFRGKALGGFGDLSIFSFQLNKNMTSGEGGLVATNDELLARRAWAVHDAGYARNQAGRLDLSGDVKTWGHCVHINELSAAVAYAQEQKLDAITAAMRARNHQLYAGLSQIPGVIPRRVVDPDGDSGPFVIVTLPDAEKAAQLVEATRAAGVRPGPKGIGNIRMSDWHLHLYWNNVSLVEKQPVHSSGRPWNDPLNAFHKEFSYEHGTLPVMDDLMERSILITVPPVLSEQTTQRIIEIYQQCAAEIGLI
jgi:8-amino-3,8-dideoxy-alpha-D-manno-octulosonate transaminase